ncbi:unnamed protein product, partial [Hapterophycus canaliculatus]
MRSSGAGEYAVSTILRWLRDFREHGGFQRDSRGVHERDWIMSEEDLKGDLLRWMKAQKRLTVQDVCTFINESLFANEGGNLERLLNYQVTLPVSLFTAHSWMVRLGCRYERATKTFYIDGHERADVVEYRGEYVEIKRTLALRQPVWVQLRVADLDPTELERINKLKEEVSEGDSCAEVHDCTISGDAYIEFHVDFLNDNGVVDNFDRLRADLGPEGGGFSVRFEDAGKKCKCTRQVRHTGQDESCYKSYAREGKEWVIQGVRGLRKKTGGPGEVVSAFQDERYGFGLPLSDEKLNEINEVRKMQGKKALSRSPGLRFLVYGGQKDGCWGFDQFREQVEDMMDAHEVIEPHMQLVIEVDHSSGHAKQREDGLNVANMNVRYGGKQRVLRDTVMTEGCVGPSEA